MARYRKHGKGYQLIAYNGYDKNGKQIIKTKQWNPPETMKQREINRQLPILAAEFEKEFLNEAQKAEQTSDNAESNAKELTLHDFLQIWITNYVKIYLRFDTTSSYLQSLDYIDMILGEKRLQDITVKDIKEFQNKLKSRKTYASTSTSLFSIDLRTELQKQGYSMTALCNIIGISRSTFRNACIGIPIRNENAQSICESLSLDPQQSFHPAREAQPISSGTVTKTMSILHELLQEAVSEELIDRNPCDAVKKTKNVKKEVKHYPMESLNKLLDLLRDEAPYTMYLLTLLIAESGLRRSEALGLQWDSLNTDLQTIHIKQGLHAVHVTPNQKRKLILSDTKTVCSNRIIGIGYKINQLLMSYHKQQQEDALQMGDQWMGDVIPNLMFTRANGLPINPESYSKWLSNFAEKHGLPHVTPHMLRHSKASYELMCGVPITEVANMLGHASSSTTLNIYAHFIPNQQKKHANQFEAMLLNETSLESLTQTK